MAISGSIGVEVLPVINKGKFQAELKRQIGSIQLKEVKVHLTPTIAFGEVRKAARVAARLFVDDFNRAVSGKLRLGKVTPTGQSVRAATGKTQQANFTGAVIEGTSTFAQKIQNFENLVNKSLGRIGLNLRNVAILIGAGLSGDIIVAGLRLITQGIKEVFNSALQFNEAITSTRAIFGDAAGGVIEFAEDSKRSLFETRKEALETANTFGLIFRRLGDDSTIAKLSVAFGQIAQDFSALLGGDVSAERITNILREGLKGDLEDLGKIGLLIDDTDIKLRALREGFVGANDALTAQSRVAITAAIILEQAADVLGEAGTRSETAAGKVAAFRREFEKLKEDFGTAILPALTGILTLITEFLKSINPLVEAIAAWGQAQDQVTEKTKANKEELEALSKSIIENAKALDQVVVTLNSLSDLALLQNFLEAEIALERATIEVSNAELSLREAHLAVTRAAIDETRAEVNLERAQLGVQESSIALQQAEIGLRQEALASIKTTNQLADAQQDLSIILDPAHREVALTAANLALVDAQNNVIDQVDKERDAFIALRRAQLDQFDTLEDIIRRRRRGVFRARDVLELSLLEAEANKQVVDSLKAVERLPIDRAKSDLALRQAELALQQTKIDLDREERDARLAVLDAELSVAEAAIRSTDGRTVAELALAGAKLSVRDASLSVRDAEIAVQTQNIETIRVNNALKLAHLDVRTAIIEVGKANEAYQVLLSILNGKTLDAEGRQRAFRDGIASVAEYITGSEAQSALSGLLTFYDDLIVKQKTAIINLETEKKLLQERSEALQNGPLVLHENDPQQGVLGTAISTTVGVVAAFLKFLNPAPGRGIKDIFQDLENLGAALSDFFHAGEFAGGGKFEKNKLIRVGEHGPEFIFTGNNEGKVINSRQTDQLGTGQTNNITIVEAQRSNDAMAFAVAARLGRRVFN